MRQIVFEADRLDDHYVAELERELHNLSKRAIPVVDGDCTSPVARTPDDEAR